MRSWLQAPTGFPLKLTTPESGVVIYVIMRMVDVLPAPLGPSSPSTRPAWASNEMLLTAILLP